MYRNPGQEIEQAVSLNGSAYMDLPVALRYRKEYVKGCSCKQAEYNPTEIEAANKRAEADATAKPVKGKATAKAPAPPPAAQAAAPAGATGAQPSLDLDVTGSNPPAACRSTCGRARRAEAARARDGRGTASAAAPPASASAAPPPQGQSTVIKKAPKPPVAPPAAIMSALSGLAFEPRLSACAADQRQQNFELGSMLARR